MHPSSLDSTELPSHVHHPACNDPANRPRTGLLIAVLDPDESLQPLITDLVTSPPLNWKLACYKHPHQAVRHLAVNGPAAFLLANHSDTDFLRRLKLLFPDLPLVVCTRETDPDFILRCLLSGVSGYVVEPLSEASVVSAVLNATRGLLALCNRSNHVLHEWLQRVASVHARRELTVRESEVLPLILEGWGDKVISRRLGLSTRTIHGHRTHLYKKFGAHRLEEFVDHVLRV